MAFFNFFRFLVLSLVFAGVSSAAHAVSFLTFDASVSKRVSGLIQDYLEESEFKIALSDLNNDGLQEYIVQPGSCQDQDALCRFHVLAEHNNLSSVVSLGEIDAFGIAVGRMTFSGVKNLLVRQNPKNDFDYVVYAWDAKSSRYRMTEHSP